MPSSSESDTAPIPRITGWWQRLAPRIPMPTEQLHDLQRIMPAGAEESLVRELWLRRLPDWLMIVLLHNDEPLSDLVARAEQAAYASSRHADHARGSRGSNTRRSHGDRGQPLIRGAGVETPPHRLTRRHSRATKTPVAEIFHRGFDRRPSSVPQQPRAGQDSSCHEGTGTPVDVVFLPPEAWCLGKAVSAPVPVRPGLRSIEQLGHHQ